MERKTLILRDVPQNTPIEDVKGIFDESCGNISSIRSDVGDTWFVNFESEEDCLNTALSLTNKTFQGKPIHCCVKSENLLRGFFFHNNQAKEQQQTWNPYGDPYYSEVPVPNYGQYPPYVQYGQQWGTPIYPQTTPVDIGKPRNRGGKNRKGNANRRKKGGQYRKQRSETKSHQNTPPQLGPEHFPALPTHKKPNAVGYAKPFKKYTREQFAEVVQQMGQKGIPRPTSFPSPQECLLVRSSPATCLLLEPFPVMYPASPSPLLAAQPHHSCLPPFLDLELDLSAMPPQDEQPEASELVLDNSGEQTKDSDDNKAKGGEKKEDDKKVEKGGDKGDKGWDKGKVEKKKEIEKPKEEKKADKDDEKKRKVGQRRQRQRT